MSTRKDGGPSLQLELPLFRAAPGACKRGESPNSAAVPSSSPIIEPAAVAKTVAVVTPAAAAKPVAATKPRTAAEPSAATMASATKPAVAAKPVAASKRGTAGTGLRVIQGGGQRTHEKLASRDAVVRVLLEAGGDLLLRRISPERAGEIERRVEAVLGLFDAVDRSPALMPALERQLEDLEALMRETRELRPARRAP